MHFADGDRSHEKGAMNNATAFVDIGRLRLEISILRLLSVLLVVLVIQTCFVQASLIPLMYSSDNSGQRVLADSVARVATAPLPQPGVLRALGTLPGRRSSIIETIRSALEHEGLFKGVGGKWPIVMPVPVRSIAGW